MYFDFCVGQAGASGAPYRLDTIFHIMGNASYQTPRKHITPNKTYVVLTTHGRGMIHYDGSVRHVGKGDYLFMRPHTDFNYGCAEESWHFWWFEICEPQSFVKENQVYHIDSFDFLTRLMEESLYNAKQDHWDIAQVLIISMMMLLKSNQESPIETKSDDLLYRADVFIRDHFSTVNVSMLSAHLGVHDRTLRNAFEQSIGMSPKRYIVRLKMETAQQLLLQTSASLSTIAAQMGYSSAFHFSSSYKDYFGISPSDYRKKHYA